ncbi:MAG: PAS domain S-box protein [Deltaproteobacteria bacterium]|jgi:PAS domain S-box-containing protein|nr:PAS domain S-box protein [Deltaproteobacteria bacterium]
MNTSTFIGLLNNAALLVALALVFDTIVLQPAFEKTTIKILTGIVFGILGVAVMLTPWEFMPGVFFDTRSVILSVGGLFFGTLPTLIAVLITSGLRYFQGGVGAWTGIAVITTSAVLGVLWRHKRQRVLDSIRISELYLFGIVVHLSMLAWMLTLPWSVAKGVLSTIFIPVMVLYPIGAVLLGRLMVARINRKQEKEILKKNEERLKTIIENMPVMMDAFDENLKVVAWNAECENVTGYSADEIKQHPEPMKLLYPDPTYFKEIMEQVPNDGFDFKNKEWRLQARDGKDRIINWSNISKAHPIDGWHTWAIGIDITDKVSNYEKLRKSESLLSSFTEALPHLAFIYDEEGRYVKVFATQKDLLIEDPDILEGKLIKDVLPDELCQQFFDVINETIKTNQPQNVEYKLQVKKGERWFQGRTSLMNIEIDGKRAVVWIAFDITDRKFADNQIKASLKEKETLLQEIHHRVKNNMQIIASLLKLQLNGDKKRDVDNILKENIGRVYSMAQIHENLHRSDKLSEIDFKPYVQKLTQMLSQTYSADPRKVNFQVDTPELKLNIDKANPVGLVLNELISNSLKYAFPDGQQGTISIKSRMIDGGVIELIITDDGVGIPEGIDWESIDTLGLNLVQNLVRNQLNGSIDHDTTNGTKFIIKFNSESNYKS